jgi:hypothetical protein
MEFAMRRPVQCEGIERGPERAVQIGVVGSVQPQRLASFLSPHFLRPVGINPYVGMFDLIK